MFQRDTIAAVATASGNGGVGIVRISGPKALEIGRRITTEALKPRFAHFCQFKNKNDQLIDEGIALYFKSPSSFTGEDIVELQGHGGSLVLDLILREAISYGARIANPGEFSERAFLNGKIDLVQAEAIADIIESQSVSALRSSLKSLKGEFSSLINQLVEDVTKLRIFVEAAIDFPEEEVDFISDKRINTSLTNIISDLEKILKKAKSGAIINEGLSVVIVGKPNAGKSSLLNALAAEDVAIVTEQAGTTRDIIKQKIVIDEIPLTIIDTAGLRKSNDFIEQEGINRIKKIAETVDIVLYLRDCDSEGEEFEKRLLDKTISDHEIHFSSNIFKIVVNNKIDKLNKPPFSRINDGLPVISISAKKNQGLELLSKEIKRHYGLSNSSENTFTARRRHLTQLEDALEFLLQGKSQLDQMKAGELLAEDLRQAQNSLGEITGELSSDELLGKIFSSFCIGK